MIVQASVTWCLCCTRMNVGANSEKNISQNNHLNVLKFSGYVIPSTVNMKNFKSHTSVGVYATCRAQELVNLAVGTQCLTFATSNEWHQQVFSKHFYIHLQNVCLHTTTWLPMDGF